MTSGKVTRALSIKYSSRNIGMRKLSERNTLIIFLARSRARSLGNSTSSIDVMETILFDLNAKILMSGAMALSAIGVLPSSQPDTPNSSNFSRGLKYLVSSAFIILALFRKVNLAKECPMSCNGGR